MKRNPNATCGTCPYYEDLGDYGLCKKKLPEIVEDFDLEFGFPQVYDTSWCGQHPDFWEEETEAEPDMTDREPPTLEDVLAAYRRAVDMANMYSGRICDACAHPNTVVCGRCLVGWNLQFRPKEDKQ